VSRVFFFGLGCLFTVAFEPAGLWALAPALLMPFLYVCLTLPGRAAAQHGFCFGLGLFLCGTYWIYLSVTGPGQGPWWIGAMLVILLTLVMASYLAITAWLINRFGRDQPWRLLVVAPVVWTLVEWLRGWLFSGFPWMSLGYAQIDTAVAGWAPVLGVYGVTLLLVFSSAAALVAVLQRGRQRGLALFLLLLPWLTGAALMQVGWTSASGTPVRTTVLQAGVGQERKWLPEEREPTKEFYSAATRSAAGSQLVVWPEVAIPSVTDREEAYIESLHGIAMRNNQAIIFGILEREFLTEGGANIYNSVLLVQGGTRQVYRKRHLVPFGEYFPVPAAVREWLRMMNLPFSDITPGADKQQLLTVSDGTRVAVAICYEDSYGAEMLPAFPDASILINVSNDGWFGNSIAPHQHLQIARMRSLETGRFTVRATNTGISAFIDASGRVLQSGPQFEATQMTADMERRSGLTPYARYGNWPVVSLCLLVLAGFWLRSRAS
jgi:apolipoprotein N-acyltransferase